MVLVNIKNLYLKYLGATKASIEDISLEVNQGDTIAILGPSGCGKTTLLHVIAGLIDEKDAKISGTLTWEEDARIPLVRMVFQEATLLPWRSVEKNVALGLEALNFSKEEIEKKVQEILRLVGLWENAKQLPRELSIGMQQRVNFARALVCEPDLLLLDEPFSALDVKTKKHLQQEFLKILEAKKITSIFVTHNIEEALTVAKKIVVLSAGPSTVSEIFENGTLNAQQTQQHYFETHDDE